MAKDKDYAVGRGRPPREHQFKPGQSGNPKGRPRRSPTFQSEMMEELLQEITIKEGGRPIRVTKLRALLKAITAKAMSGDSKTQKLLIEMIAKGGERPAGEDDALDDNGIIASYMRRNGVPGGSDE